MGLLSLNAKGSVAREQAHACHADAAMCHYYATAGYRSDGTVALIKLLLYMVPELYIVINSHALPLYMFVTSHKGTPSFPLYRFYSNILYGMLYLLNLFQVNHSLN